MAEKTEVFYFLKILEHNSCINSEDPDQTAPQEQSDHSLHCLLTICKGFPQKENKGLRLSSKVEESITKLRVLIYWVNTASGFCPVPPVHRYS